jgi:hypothetical protein
MPPRLTEELAQELNHASRDDLVAWLHRALAGEDPRLPVGHDETPDIGIDRIISRLQGDTRQVLREAVVLLLREWNRSQPWPISQNWSEAKIDALVSVVLNMCTAKDAAALTAVDLLWKLIQDPGRFDILPRYLQIRIQNTLEQYSDLFPVEGWRALAGRDPDRFGPTVFGALARSSLNDALSILPDLSESPQVLDALRMRARWLLTSLPETTRHQDLARISQALNQARPQVQAILRSAFANSGAALPAATPPPRFARVLVLLQKEPAPRGALNTYELAA